MSDDPTNGDDAPGEIATFDGLIEALLDPADRGRKAVAAYTPRSGEPPRSDAFNAPTKSGSDRSRGRRRGGR